MGVSHSLHDNLHENDPLKKLVGKEPIEHGDSFYTELVDFRIGETPTDKGSFKQLRNDTRELCIQFGLNNLSSGNFATLVKFSIELCGKLTKVKEEDANITDLEQGRNVLLIIRIYCVYMVENFTVEDIARHFSSNEAEASLLEEYLLALTENISFLRVSTNTYHFLLEVVSSFLVLLSCQMFQPSSTKNNIHTHLTTSKQIVANAQFVMRTCLHNFIKNPAPPTSQSVANWAFSGLLSMLREDQSEPQQHPLAYNSSCLLLLYAFHQNPYSDALVHLRPGGVDTHDVEEGAKEKTTQMFSLNFKRFYSAIKREIDREETVLLLYFLLHKNLAFTKFLLEQDDIENMVLPLLKVLYRSEEKKAHHIYMALICILLLTQQAKFNEKVHQINLKDSSWYNERSISGLSLGSAIVLVLLRTIQFNMAKTRDKYLHTNCLACLANMSNKFDNIHPLVNEKIIKLLDNLIKRHKRALSKSEEILQKNEQATNDTDVLEEIIFTLLEIINASLTANLAGNTKLVFALLRNKELIESFRNASEKFAGIVDNLDKILGWFGDRVDLQIINDSTPEDIICMIKESSSDFDTTTLKKFPALMFRYVEESAAEEFFIPYIWSLVYTNSNIHWDPKKITLFKPSVANT